MCKKYKAWLFVMLGLLGITCLCACGEERQEKTEYKIYYLDEDEVSLYEVEYEPQRRVTEAMIDEIFSIIQTQIDEKNYKNLLPESVSILDYELTAGRVVVNFHEDYVKMNNTREFLARAGIVKSLIQIPGVQEVQFLLNGTEMTDSQGTVYPVMTKNSFVESDGNNINSYQYTTLDLYFANATGERLVKERVNVYYSSNVPLEQVIVEQLQKGPRISGHLSIIPVETKILNVSVVDGICYVNLDGSFNNPMASTPVKPEVIIASIVNSIMDECEVTKVQISIDGVTDVVFRDTFSLNQFFTRNRELVMEVESE